MAWLKFPAVKHIFIQTFKYLQLTFFHHLFIQAIGYVDYVNLKFLNL